MDKSSFLAVVLGVTLLLGVGCKKQSDPSGQSSATGRRGMPNRVIAVIPKSTNLVFWQSVLAGAQAAGKEYGYEIYWNGPDRETNSARQIQTIDDAIARNMAGVVLAPVDREALVPSVDKLAGLDIPCAIIDSGLDTVKFLCIASTDNEQAGQLAARRMGAILGGKGNVIVVRHIPGSQSTAKRVAGFAQAIAKEFPDIKIVDSQSGQDTVEAARQVTEEMLKRHPDVQGLFACNITTSVGALQALQRLQRGEVKMVAFDPDKALIDGLRQGRIAAIILQNPYQMGYEGVKAVALTYKRQPRVIDTGLQILTTESLNDPSIKRLVDTQ